MSNDPSARRPRTLRFSLVALAALTAVGLISVFFATFLPLRSVLVNGDRYREIAQAKDLTADILPPPAYALEAYAMAERAARVFRWDDETARSFAKARSEFVERQEFWERTIGPGPVRSALAASKQPGVEFFDIVERELAPAIRAGDRDRAHVIVEKAEKAFERHDAIIRGVADKAIAEVTRFEAATAEAIRVRTATAAALTLLLLLAAGGMSLLAVGRVRSAVAGLAGRLVELGVAVGAGRLDGRVDAGQLAPEFEGIARAFNQTMDSFAVPIQASAECVESIARGELPPPITAEYHGEFNRIKASLNELIDLVQRRARDIDMLIAAAAEGRLATRADASKYQGSNVRVIEGMNKMLDAVMKPIGEATQVLDRLAQRDLRARVKGSYQGDYAKIADALNATAGALDDAMSEVAQTVDQVSSASSQIASSSQAVASGASEQASSLEETGSGLESMASMTKGAADNAQQASVLAVTARGSATEGSTAMEQMTGAMARIKASAEGTSQIIKDINEIAFQTNLLALNAAVEAARAGEAGRGFAVVAEEVRSLALRSKEAANKTEALIRQSVKEAGEGEVTAKHVSGKLTDIVASVSKVTDIVAEIAATSKEQSAGIEQVNKAMSQMSTVTQQNAASSEESSSAAAELSGQSEKLAAMVGAFQLSDLVKTRKQTALTRNLVAPVRKATGVRRNGHAGFALSSAEEV
jgi:methyl-accepting chemotaxis protein